MRRLALAALLVAVVEPAIGAGRKPYGGAIEIPVRDFSGLDAFTADSRSGRLVASLVHGHLFRMSGGEIVPELAAGPGVFSGDTFTVPLLDTARCHDGKTVEASDVVKSWRALGAAGDASPIGRLAAKIEASEAGPHVVQFAARGVAPEELKALLARPEAAILAKGQLGQRCGAFKVHSSSAERLVLVAWDGYGRGRPWLQEVRLEKVASAREEAAFRFGEVELAFEPPQVMPAGATSVRGGWTSWLVVFHPRFRGRDSDKLRGWVHAASLDGRLMRYIDGRSLPGEVPWPESLSPVAPAPIGARSAIGRDTLVVAYAEGEQDSEELARAVRDVVRPITRVDARVSAVRGLDMHAARTATDPPWDLALVRLEWGSLTRAQAAWELARALGLPQQPAIADVLAGRVGEWARVIVQRTDALAIVHAERPAFLHAKIRGVVPAGPLPDLLDAWASTR